MTELYSSINGINPFIVAPGEGAIQQRVAVAPSGLALHPEALTNLVSEFTTEIGTELPFVSQIHWYGGFLVVSITVQTQVAEAFSGRKGLNVTFGALVPPAELGRHNLCSDIITGFRRYFQLTFKNEITVEAVSRVILARQSLSDPWNAENLRRVFYSSFLPRHRSALATVAQPFSKIYARKRLSNLAPRSMGDSVEDALRYWHSLDKALESREEGARDDRDNGVIRQTVVSSLIALCLAQFLAFAAVTWPSAPGYWRQAMSLSGTLVTLSAMLIIFSIARDLRTSSMLLKSVKFVASTVAIIALIVALSSVIATLP